ncbi:signaling lymphocytic activation molecule-like isoform X2 [Sardina pilchardus]|uniref:signaling lymphocytic activation molecule-like isoform X2 n=1 Tax=Sardina pilchardus TaxID=27697 RepID=UPI002E14F8FD
MGPFLLVLNFLAGLCFCLFARVFSDTDTQEHINMKRGDDCTLQTGTVRRSSMIILWSFITTDNDLHIAQLYNDDAKIMPTDQFRNRLHLDRHTGSLTVTDIAFMDSGLYKLNIRETQNSYKEFDVIVYGDVGEPMVTVYHSKTKLDRNCSVECSVENGREVTLSWYRGNDLLNQTSSPDLNMTLRVPLEVERHDNSIYSCVAANPVSNQTIFLNITATCSGPPDSDTSNRSYYFLFVGLLVLIASCTLFFFFKKIKKTEENPTEVEPQYTDVNYKAKKNQAKELKCEDTLYSEVKTHQAGNQEESC